MIDQVTFREFKLLIEATCLATKIYLLMRRAAASYVLAQYWCFSILQFLSDSVPFLLCTNLGLSLE